MFIFIDLHLTTQHFFWRMVNQKLKQLASKLKLIMHRVMEARTSEREREIFSGNCCHIFKKKKERESERLVIFSS
jgi:hypothetical protein